MRKYLVVGPLALLVLWVSASLLRITSPLILPPVWDVLYAIVRLTLLDGDLLSHIGLTTFRTLVSFAASCVIGIPVGLVMGYVPRVYRSLEIVVDFFRSVPPIALFPLFLLTLGIGELSKLGVPFYGCSLVIVINSIYGVQNVPSLRRTVGHVYGLSKSRVFWRIVVPDSLPQVFVGMRTALSLALVLTVVVEMFIGSENGLGKMIYDYHLLFDTPEMYAAILIVGTIGYILNKTFRLCEARIVHWADK